MGSNKLVRKLLHPLRKTFLHPQFYVFKDQEESMRHISSHASGFVLDVGAGQQLIKDYLDRSCNYLSIDYYLTSTEWYQSKPDLYADAQYLPIRPCSMDTVLLLDVLEHLPSPESCIANIEQTLKPGGILIIQTPFLYPLHDEPFDFHRWTPYALHNLADKYGFTIDFEKSIGSPTESAALLFNLAISKTILNWFKQKKIQVIFTPLLLPLIPICNLIAWFLTIISFEDSFMPQGVKMIWIKQK